MKIAIFVPVVVATLLLSGGPPAFADGYPFDPETRAVAADVICLRLSHSQIARIAATGVVTLSDDQQALLRRFYPAAAKTQAVVATTFNDNHEGLTNEDVYVLWVAGEEIAVTLNAKVIADDTLRRAALTAEPRPAPSDFRIGPDGRIYRAGKPTPRRDAEAFIARRGDEPKPEDRKVTVCVAPPFRSSLVGLLSSVGPPPEAVESQSPADVFRALAASGEAHGVAVNRTW